jgi:glycosyltransferase involved in cell wall biosynthesis
MARSPILFLSWESPWPAYGGGTLRTLGLLRELGQYFDIDLLVLSKDPLSDDQLTTLRQYARRIERVPLKRGKTSYARIAWLMLSRGIPFHCAALRHSFDACPAIYKELLTYPGVVYASFSHWGTLVNDVAANWILDQHNADVQFWQAYTSYSSGLTRLAAWVNWKLAARHFPRLYSRMSRIVAVSDEDRQLTQELAPQVPVVVVENGVDCVEFAPHKTPEAHPPRILFTGTSAIRNVTALRDFVANVWPHVRQARPEAEFVVAGRFNPVAQAEFADVPGMRFTGFVEDIRPWFDCSDVFVAPFRQAHGSKLKIAEAMAMGMAIVSTPEGVRGFALQDGQSVSVAHTNEQFAAQVIELLNQPERRERMGEAARQVALATIDWAVLGERLRAIVDDVERELANQ